MAVNSLPKHQEHDFFPKSHLFFRQMQLLRIFLIIICSSVYSQNKECKHNPWIAGKEKNFRHNSQESLVYLGLIAQYRSLQLDI